MLAQNVVPVDATFGSAKGRDLEAEDMSETNHSVSALGLSMGTLTGASIFLYFCLDFFLTWEQYVQSPP